MTAPRRRQFVLEFSEPVERQIIEEADRRLMSYSKYVEQIIGNYWAGLLQEERAYRDRARLLQSVKSGMSVYETPKFSEQIESLKPKKRTPEQNARRRERDRAHDQRRTERGRASKAGFADALARVASLAE